LVKLYPFIVAFTPACGRELRETQVVSDCEKLTKEHSEKNMITKYFTIT
jgi:hypothetical protein